MSLQANVLLDIPDLTQTLTYTVSNVMVDQITFSNNQITFASISSFNLAKSDLAIYSSTLNTFLNALIFNFPTVQNSRGLSLPVSTFEMQLATVGIEHIYYIQSSQGNSIYNTNYVPLAQSASFSARSSIVVTLQEFFLSVQMQQIYAQQVSFN